MGLGLSCSEAGGIFLDQGSHPYLAIYLLEPPGKPTLRFLSKGLFSACYQHHQRKETKIGSLMKVSIPPVGNTLEVKCASLVAQLKNPPAIWETWVRSLGREDPLEKGIYPLQYPGLEDSMDCIVYGVAKIQTRLSTPHHFTKGGRFDFQLQPSASQLSGCNWSGRNYKIRHVTISHSEVTQVAPNHISSVQFSSVAQLCLTLCDPMDCSTPGFPVHHQLPEFTQTHVH